MLEILMYFALVLFYESIMTKSKSVIVISLLLEAFSCLPFIQVGYGFLRTSPEIVIEIGLVLIAHDNDNPFQHVLICIFII